MSTARLHRVLKEVFGLDSFRPGQEDVVRAALASRNTLAIMPTGAGQSLCYQLPAVMLPGMTIVISPLIALVKDQCDKLTELDEGCGDCDSCRKAHSREQLAEAS